MQQPRQLLPCRRGIVTSRIQGRSGQNASRLRPRHVGRRRVPFGRKPRHAVRQGARALKLALGRLDPTFGDGRLVEERGDLHVQELSRAFAHDVLDAHAVLRLGEHHPRHRRENRLGDDQRRGPNAQMAVFKITEVRQVVDFAAASQAHAGETDRRQERRERRRAVDAREFGLIVLLGQLE